MTVLLDWPLDWYQMVSASFFLQSRSMIAEMPWTGHRSVYGPHAQLWMSKVGMAPLTTLQSQTPKIWEVAAILSRLDGQAGVLRMGHVARSRPQFNGEFPVADNFTRIMLHMDGPSGSRLFHDPVRLWSVLGNAQLINTPAPKFGVTSAAFDGASMIITPAAQDLNLGARDFTIEHWIKATTDSGVFITCGQLDGGGGVPNSAWYIAFINGTMQGVLEFDNPNGNTDQYSVSSTSLVTVARGWTHVAIVRAGTSFKIFMDGVLEAQATIPAGPVNTSTSTLGVGGAGADFQAIQWNGLIDDFRLSIGVARYSANFTPTGPFVTPADLVVPATALVATAAKRGDSNLQIGRLPVSTNRILRRGDLFEVQPGGTFGTTSHLYEVQVDGSTNSSGVTDVEIRPRLRADLAAGDMVIFFYPSALFYVIDDLQGDMAVVAFGNAPNKYAQASVVSEQFSFSLVEAIP